ncbi:MAG: SDR family NAD(P)-dependent oxidoreductase, partial [Candidatus Hydrogenedentes bacterium]|nr:SDR family NAD(P)-dependent oxidoreductase [Candidatus Hydrogenedentota bacterium]
CGAGPAPGKLALVFSGQGAQQPGMLRDLVCTFPEMFESLELAEAIFEQQTGEGLHGFIHPQPAFSKEARASQEEVLRNTAVAQPALGAVEAGAIKLLRRFGLHPDAYAGHSYGELAALHAAGCYDESTLFRLSCARGELMAHGDSGTGMLAVRAGVAQVESMLRESGLHLTIANKNAPEQTVLSGPKSALEQAAALFKARNLSATTLPVAAAFHSEHVSAASAPFLLVLREAAIGAPGAPVYANTSAAPYPQDIDALREQLAAQLARPVEFIAQVERMHAEGVRTFVEVGPGARITGLIQAILQGRDFTAAALDTTSAKRCGIEPLARLLAQLAALGYPVLLEAWNADVAEAAPRKKPRMTVKLCGANYVSPRKESRPARNRPAPSTTATAGPASQTGKIGKTQPQAQDHHAGVTMNQETSQKRPANSGSPPVPASDSQDGHPNGEILMALQRLQEQTAQLHRQFLEGQQAALATFQMLLRQPAGEQPLAARNHRDDSIAGLHPQAAKLEGGATRATIASEDSKPADASKAISELLLRTVAEKTGYPVEMLELGMSLDADLGIDSIKRVEILSSFREQMPEAPEIGADQVGRLQTLQQIVEFIAGSRDQKDERDRKDQRDDGDSQAIGNLLLLVVAEKTGYPAEMLELGMSLDADLGIDSIKRVEILSSFRELMPDAPEVGPEQVGQLQTLQQIVDFIAGNKGARDSRDNSDRKDPKDSNAISGLLLATVAEKTGYPAEMLELEMSLDADLGIDSIKRVEILSALQEKLPGAPQPGPEMVGKLQTLADIVAFLAQGETTAEAPAPPAEVRPPEISRSMRTVERMVLTSALLEEQPVKAVSVSAAPVWITDDSGGLAQTLQTVLAAQGWRPEIVTLTETLQPPERLAGAVLLAPSEGADDLFLSNAFIFAQNTAPALRRASQDAPAFFVTVSRLDGCFGYRPEAGIRDVVSGGLAGLAKTAHHEWPEVQCRALDLAPEFDAAAAAERIAQELLGGGPREVGLAPEGRLWLQLSPVPAGLLNGLRPLQPGDPVVITGGARGVTAEVAVALAQRFQPTLILLGRSALKEEPAWLAPLRDEAGIKRALMEHGVNTPRELSQQTAALLANREIHANIVRMQAAGSRVSYHSVDIRDSATVAAIVQDVRAQYGPIRGVVHGAGVIADKLIQDKTAEQFRNVYSTKVEGLRKLLEAVSGDPLRVLVLFSSSTGRYGRRGQVDYAMANEVLNKLAHVEQRNRPECRVVAVNWGPWEGGMVTPALKKVFEEEGVGLIDLEVGARYLIQEISQDKDRAAEVVVFGFPAPKKDTAAQEPAAQHPAAAGPPLSLAFAIDLNTEDHSFLRSHVLKGHAVLPVVMMIEWFSQAALHTTPGLRFHGLNNLRVFKGVKLDDGERLKLSFLSGKAQHQDGLYVVPVELRSTRAEATDVVHASAEVLLAAQPLEGHVELVVDGPCDKMLPEGEYYTNGNLFHGPHFQGLSEASFSHGELMRALVQAAPAPAQWIARPLRNSWITDPLALDCALQLTILWTFEHYGVASLPGRIQEYRQFRAYPRRPMRVTARMTQHNEHHATADIEFTERESGLLIARLRGYECTLDRSLNEVFKQNALA